MVTPTMCSGRVTPFVDQASRDRAPLQRAIFAGLIARTRSIRAGAPGGFRPHTPRPGPTGRHRTDPPTRAYHEGPTR